MNAAVRRVLITTSVPLLADGSWPRVIPDHHVFAANRFRRHGYQVIPVPLAADSRLRTLRGLPGGTRYGDVARQAAAFLHHREADLLFDPWDIRGDALLLGGLRAAGLLRRPLVAYIHSRPLSGSLAWQRPVRRAFFSGCDALPAMSESVAAELAQHGGWAAKTCLVRPGPDAGYYEPSPGPGREVLCVGKSLRDFETLGRAASQTSARVHIVCPTSEVTAAFSSFGPNVRVTVPRGRHLLPRDDVDPLLRESRAIAIPLTTTRLMAGLWSLFDALGFGKAVLATRHPGLPVDIEREGIGRWLEPGDERGWADALQYIEDNGDEAAAMGRRARALVDGGLDSASFAEQITGLFDRVLAGELG